MRCRGIVEVVDRVNGRLALTHNQDAELFAVGDELYTRADVPELVALELKRRGQGVVVPGPFALTNTERTALVDSRTYPAVVLVEAIERACNTLAIEPLSDREERHVQACENDVALINSKPVFALLEIIRKRFPKAAPTEKTPGQTLCEAMDSSRWEHADKMHYEAAAAKLLAAHGGPK